MQIDARGKGRPVPVMMTEEAVSRVTEGIVEVVVDNEESIRIETTSSRRTQSLLIGRGTRNIRKITRGDSY